MISRKVWIIIVSLAALVGLSAGWFVATRSSEPHNHLQVSIFVPHSDNPAVQDIHCQGGSTTDRVMGPAKKQFNTACKFILQGKDLIWGNQSCREKAGNNKNTIVFITGKVGSKAVRGVYQIGPCASGTNAWIKMSAIWQQDSPTQGWVPVKALVLAPEGEFKDPGTWPERERWLQASRRSGVVPKCTQSLPNLDFQICLLPQSSPREEQMTVRLTTEQLYGLIKASPQKVLQILDQAKHVPPPPGFPGYVPPQG
jgi:hypothetical protein